jgi:hypothetical protein
VRVEGLGITCRRPLKSCPNAYIAMIESDHGMITNG